MNNKLLLPKHLSKTAIVLTISYVIFLVIANIIALVLANDKWACFIEYLLPFNIAGVLITSSVVYLAKD
jgi:hypothetical protein